MPLRSLSLVAMMLTPGCSNQVKIIGRRIVAALAMVLIVQAGGICRANASSGSAPDPSQDPAMIKFLQRHFRIPNANQITLSPPAPAPIEGLWSRKITLVGDSGQTASATLFEDSSGKNVIIGTLLETSKDPWERVDLKGIHLDDRPAAGPADAPVTVVEFGDFECPYCARALNIVETLVNSTYKGRVRLLFKNFPLSGHLWAMEAATAAECARLQNPDAFWQMARDLYRDQASIDPRNIRGHIDQYAGILQLDKKALSACMMSLAATQRVQQDMQDGQALKVESTPTFYVNGIPVIGFPDEKSLRFVIDSELRASQTAAAKH